MTNTTPFGLSLINPSVINPSSIHPSDAPSLESMVSSLMQTVHNLDKRVNAHDELLRRLGALEEENSSLKKEVSRLNSLLAAKPQPVLPPAEQNSPRHQPCSNSD